jgi:hypothetical protein
MMTRPYRYTPRNAVHRAKPGLLKADPNGSRAEREEWMRERQARHQAEELKQSHDENQQEQNRHPRN